MNSPLTKRSVLWGLLTAILILYWFAPIIAGLFPDVDRRGPKIFWIEHHELLCTLAHEFVYDVKPRPSLSERAWFYGLKGKPYVRLDLYDAIRDFEEKAGESSFLALRQSAKKGGQSRLGITIARSEWPQSFSTNGVIEVRTEKYGIYVVLKRSQNYEGGIFLLGTESDRDTVENDRTYSKSIFGKVTFIIFTASGKSRSQNDTKLDKPTRASVRSRLHQHA